MDQQACHHLLNSLSDYLDGDLGQELCMEIERHLADCQNCQVVVDTLKKTVYLYQVTKPDAGLPEPVRERLYHRLNLDEFLKKT